MHYDDDQTEVLVMATEQFRFHPPLPLLDCPMPYSSQASDDHDPVEVAGGTEADPVCADHMTAVSEQHAVVEPELLGGVTSESRVVPQSPEAVRAAQDNPACKPALTDQANSHVHLEGQQAAKNNVLAIDACGDAGIDKAVLEATSKRLGNTDAFDYLPSQAEGGKPHAAQSKVGAGSHAPKGTGAIIGQGRGRKRAPNKPTLPAKRHKQLPAAKSKAAIKHTLDTATGKVGPAGAAHIKFTALQPAEVEHAVVKQQANSHKSTANEQTDCAPKLRSSLLARPEAQPDVVDSAQPAEAQPDAVQGEPELQGGRQLQQIPEQNLDKRPGKPCQAETQQQHEQQLQQQKDKSGDVDEQAAAAPQQQQQQQRLEVPAAPNSAQPDASHTSTSGAKVHCLLIMRMRFTLQHGRRNFAMRLVSPVLCTQHNIT